MAKWEEAPEIEEAPEEPKTTAKWEEAPETPPQEPEDDSFLKSAVKFGRDVTSSANPVMGLLKAGVSRIPGAKPTAEALATLASGSVAQPLSGLVGLGASLIPGVSAADAIKKVQDTLTYAPKSETANTALGYMAYPFEKLTQGTEALGEMAGGDLGAMLGRTGGEMLPTLIPGVRALKGSKVSPTLAALRARSAAARAAGYKIPPVMAGDESVLANIAQGGGGKIKTQQAASIANQELINSQIKSDLGIHPDQPVTTGLLAQIRSDAGKHYEAIKSLPGKFKSTDQYIDGLYAIGRESRELAREFPKQSVYDKEIKPLIDDLARKEMTPRNAINLSRQLRSDAKTNLKNMEKPEKLELGLAQKRAAALLENMIDHNLDALGKPELLSNFQNARQLIAKTHDAEKALNESTGNFQASRLGSMLDKDKPLTGGMRTAAEFYRSFPKAAQSTEAIGGVSHISPLDLAAGASYGIAGGLSKGAFGSLAGMIPGLRPLARKAVLSDWYQRGNRNPVKGPLSGVAGKAPFLAASQQRALPPYLEPALMQAEGED